MEESERLDTERLMAAARTLLDGPDDEEFLAGVESAVRAAPNGVTAQSAMMKYLDSLRPPHPLEAQGWRYVDPPSRFSPEFWHKLLATIGEENYLILGESSGNGLGGPWARGQLMVSPQGILNWANRAEEVVA